MDCLQPTPLAHCIPTMLAPDRNDPLRALLRCAPGGGLLLLRDCLACSGHVLLPSLVTAALAQGDKVVVVAAAYSPAKHRAAVRRASGPHQQPQLQPQPQPQPQQQPPQLQRVAFVPVPSKSELSPPPQQQPQERQLQQEQERQPSQLPRFGQLYQQVEMAARHLAAGGQPGQLMVMLDSVPVLAALAPSGCHLEALLHQLAVLGEVLGVPCRLVVLGSSDLGGGGAHQAQVLQGLAARAHAVADLTPVEGRTASLDGRLSIRQQRSSSLGLGGTWFFRAGDMGLSWIGGRLSGRDLLVS